MSTYDEIKCISRLKQLKAVHFLSTEDITKITGINKASYEVLESHGIIINPNDIDLLCYSFGISKNWLLGNSKETEIYDENFILDLERNYINGNYFGINEYQVLPSGLEVYGTFPKLYYDEESRIINYSLPIRANIIFLVTCHRNYFEYFYNKFVFYDFTSKHYAKTNSLFQLMSKELTEPLFTFSKNVKFFQLQNPKSIT